MSKSETTLLAAALILFSLPVYAGEISVGGGSSINGVNIPDGFRLTMSNCSADTNKIAEYSKTVNFGTLRAPFHAVLSDGCIITIVKEFQFPTVACKVGDKTESQDAYIVSCYYSKDGDYAIDSKGRIILNDTKAIKKAVEASRKYSYKFIKSDENSKICIDGEWFKILRVDAEHGTALLAGPILHPTDNIGVVLSTPCGGVP